MWGLGVDFEAMGEDWRALRGLAALQDASHGHEAEGASPPDTVDEAWQRLREGDLEQALAFWSAAGGDDSDLVGLGLACALTLQEGGRAAEARDLYVQVLERDRRVARGWYLLGLLHAEEGYAAEAIEALQEAVSCEPGAAPAWSALGQLRWQLGDRAGARGAFETAIGLQADDALSRQSLALLMLQEGHLAEARVLLEALVAEAPEDARTWLCVGQLESASGDWSATVQAHERAAELQPEWAEPWVQLGMLAWNIGQIEAAEASLRLGTALDPHHLEAHRLLALVAHRRDDAVESQRHADLMLMEAPDSEDAVLLRAAALARQDRVEEASVSLDRWMSLMTAGSGPSGEA